VLSQMGTLLASPGQEIAPDHTARLRVAPGSRSLTAARTSDSVVRGGNSGMPSASGLAARPRDREHSIDNRICPQPDHVQGTIATVAGL
jgi:hypothetical protein